MIHNGLPQRKETPMRIAASTAAAIAGALATATLGLAGAAVAAPVSHHASASARADWKRGAQVSAAEQGRYWLAARKALPTRFAHERGDLAALASIPLTNTTAKQRATATRATRELNGFFRTPDLYGVAAGKPIKFARADWIKSAHVIAARQNIWLGGANDELAAYGNRYQAERADLTSLESIPETSTTAKQRAIAERDRRALDKFFHTPGLGG
jgi:hypothetical protein